MNSAAFVQKEFQRYYNSDYAQSHDLVLVEEREFGFASFDGWMLRHRSFKDEDDLALFLRESVPRDAYVSCAYYEDPVAEMDKKGWKGADLVFDIDADHIPTTCDKIHDKWQCSRCGFAGRGATPQQCPACGAEKFDGKTWPCEVCLASAKTETTKLFDMLADDLGFSENEIHVFFSGHRGYHVHVENESARALSAIARKEIVDYVSGIGLSLPLNDIGERSQKTRLIYQNKDPRETGWPRRLSLGIKNLVLSADGQTLLDLGIRKKESKALLAGKASLSEASSDSGTRDSFKGVGVETWSKMAERAVEMQSAKVDTVVTTDVHRLIRLPETLHGKTGFRKVGFRSSALGDFDPFRNAVAFKGGSTTVFVSYAPQFRLGEETFGPYKNQRVELPTATAVLLVCRGRADVVE